MDSSTPHILELLCPLYLELRDTLKLYPTNISLVGSPKTPYIWDDRCDARDVAEQIKSLYDMADKERNSHNFRR